MFEKDFIPYDLALRLKSLGFEERCFSYYYTDGRLKIPHFVYERNSKLRKGWCLAPTFPQAFRWIREKYDLHLLPIRSVNKWYTTFGSWISSSETYEEAEIACLEKLIEIVEQEVKG